MAGIAACAFCDRPLHLPWETLMQARRAGLVLYCDEVCHNAGEPYRQKIEAFLPKNMDRALCRHDAGTVGGRCLDCGGI